MSKRACSSSGPRKKQAYSLSNAPESALVPVSAFTHSVQPPIQSNFAPISSGDSYRLSFLPPKFTSVAPVYGYSILAEPKFLSATIQSYVPFTSPSLSATASVTPLPVIASATPLSVQTGVQPRPQTSFKVEAQANVLTFTPVVLPPPLETAQPSSKDVNNIEQPKPKSEKIFSLPPAMEIPPFNLPYHYPETKSDNNVLCIKGYLKSLPDLPEDWKFMEKEVYEHAEELIKSFQPNSVHNQEETYFQCCKHHFTEFCRIYKYVEIRTTISNFDLINLRGQYEQHVVQMMYFAKILNEIYDHHIIIKPFAVYCQKFHDATYSQKN